MVEVRKKEKGINFEKKVNLFLQTRYALHVVEQNAIPPCGKLRFFLGYATLSMSATAVNVVMRQQNDRFIKGIFSVKYLDRIYYS